MNNRSINSHLKEYAAIRQNWIALLNENAGNSEACYIIVQINAKMDAYRSLWNWSDETVEMDAHYRN